MNHPYEIHLTVPTANPNEFINACRDLNIKPVLLELQSQSLGVLQDAMTSSTLVGTYLDALKQMYYLTVNLRLNHNIWVSRAKIETVPWHPDALKPVAERECWQYFESHLALEISREMSENEFGKVASLCWANELHLSQNVFKAQGANVIHMATLRDYKATADDFVARVNRIKAELAQEGIKITKSDVEFALLDTNPRHDAPWLELDPPTIPQNNMCPEITNP